MFFFLWLALWYPCYRWVKKYLEKNFPLDSRRDK